MNRVRKSVAVILSTALLLTGVNGAAQAAPTTTDPAVAKAQEALKVFKLRGVSEDQSTLYIEKGKAALADQGRSLEFIDINGRSLGKAPLRGFDASRNATFPLAASISDNGKAITFRYLPNAPYTPLTAQEVTQQQRLKQAAKNGGAVQDYITLAQEATIRDPLSFYGGGVSGCIVGACLSFLAGFALAATGSMMWTLATAIFWPLWVVSGALWVGAAVAYASAFVTCPVGFVIGSSALATQSKDPVVAQLSRRFYTNLFNFNWF